MRLVLQRVSSARVDVEGICRGRIGRGLVALVGFVESDSGAEVAWGAEKIAHLRIFEDADGKMNRSVLDVSGAGAAGDGSGGVSSGAPAESASSIGGDRPGVLLIPNFTLAGDASRGRRPSFDRAMRPERSGPMFDEFCAAVGALGVHVERGVFRAAMSVSLVNDGPVTIVLDSPTR